MQVTENDKRKDAEIVAEQNDIFRKSFGADARVPGKVVFTQGVAAMDSHTAAKIVEAIKAFDDFTKDADPHGEHDFGAVEIDGTKVWFKIDLFDPDYLHGSEDPTSPALTRRVLTVMLPEEY